MKAYICTVCGFLYDKQSADKDPEGNIIQFEEVGFDWVCPICGGMQETFKIVESNRMPNIPDPNEGEK